VGAEKEGVSLSQDRPSRTAQLVAIGRAMADIGISHVPDFHDPTARHFLNARGLRSLAKVEHVVGSGKGGVNLAMARRMADLMALRTTTIDAAVREAVAGGAKQLVILGAGYDGRAWRMPELRGVEVFEVDRPATQEEKRRHAERLTPVAKAVRFVPTDFKEGTLDAALASAGHSRSITTCWIWEGVVMYLAREVVRATLAEIAARSAPGSTLIVNYHAPNRRWVAKLALWMIGEPQIGDRTREEMAEDLQSAGFTVRDDSGMADWNARFASGKARVEKAWYMRAVIAQT
jgi:methyltransferase (TIGR00027 family)